MTRSEARANLESLGFAEVTDEMITNYLNQLQGETRKYSDRVEQGKKDAELVDELKAKLEAIENQNLSDIEKANKSVETANKTIADLEAKMRAMELKTSLAEKGIVGEDADKLIESLGSGTLDVEVLGKIISTKMAESATAKEKEIADNSTNPNGGTSGKNPDEDKTPDVLQAESMANAFGNKADATNKDYYVVK